MVLVILALAGRADASAWYYKWSCAGACAPNQLAIRGVTGPFPSEEMCNDARWGDSRRWEFVGPGNLGGLGSCAEYEGTPTADDVGTRGTSRPIPTQRYLLAFVGGPAWRVRDAAGDTEGRSTFGMDVNLVGGGRPYIGIETGLGIHRAPIRSPRWTGDVDMLVIPWTIGLASSPGILRTKKLELRLDLGADVGFLFRTSCDECNDAGVSGSSYVWILRGGLDIYPRAARTPGIGIHALFWFGKQGSLTDETAKTAIEILPPTLFLEVALLGRNGALFW
ncbi:hypothetical protein BH11MYX3_BH11MYX3_32650 [soil metagenome]